MNPQQFTEPPMQPPPDAKYGIWLRASSPSGIKDWLCFQTDKDIQSYWGNDGNICSKLVICKIPSRPYLDAMVTRKRAIGYRFMMEWDKQVGWHDQQGPIKVSSGVAKLPPPPPLPLPAPKPAVKLAPKPNPVKDWLKGSMAEEVWF